MSEFQNQSFEVIAKEITIAIIEKYNFKENALEEICKIYDRIHEQVIDSYNLNYKK